MALPSRAALESALLHVLADAGGSLNTKTAYARVANFLEIAVDDMLIRNPDGRSKLEHELRWAKDSLRRKGLLDSEGHGIWVLSKAGRQESQRRWLDSNDPTRHPESAEQVAALSRAIMRDRDKLFEELPGRLSRDDQIILDLIGKGATVREMAQAFGESLRAGTRRFSAATHRIAEAIRELQAIRELHTNEEVPEVELYVDPGAAGSDEVQALLTAINELHIAAGGLGFDFLIDGLYVRTREAVPA